MAARHAISIDGLGVFVRNLKVIDSQLPKTLRVGLNQSAEVILDYARPRIPKRSGRAVRSLKARSTQNSVRIAAGGPRAVYYPWLDFGGHVGPGGSVARPFRKDGRYIYAAYFARRAEFAHILERALLDTVRAAGIEVD